MSDAERLSPPPERRLSRIPFTARDEASVLALSQWMRIAAVISFVAAVLKAVSAFTPRQDPSKLIDAAITFLIGLWVFQAGSAFNKVATTDAADQRHLMEGFTLLRRVFLLQAILVILVLCLLVVALLLTVVFMAGRAS